MLSKLVGYEMKAFGRILLPIYGAIVVTALLLGINMHFISFSENAGAIALSIVLAILVAAVFIVTILLSVIRFYNNLLGREGYLMFSLPVGTGDLIWAKVISSVIWCILSWIVAVLSVLPFLAAPEVADAVKEYGIGKIWAEVTGSLSPYRWNLILGIVLIIALAVFFIVRLYAAISIGHLWTEHRILGAVLAYIGIGVLEAFLAMPVGTYISLYWSGTGAVGITNALQGEGILLLIAAAGTAVYGVVTWLILDRKLNLE